MLRMRQKGEKMEYKQMEYTPDNKNEVLVADEYNGHDLVVKGGTECVNRLYYR